MSPVVPFRQRRGLPAWVRQWFAFLAFAIVFASNAGALTTTREYDLRNRLTNITSVSSGSAPAASAAYNYNLAQQRTKRTEADGSFWTYQYDALGQVTVGTRQWADGTLVPGQQFEFTYDDIGNRRETRTGGDAYGSNLRVSTYAQTNRLNQVAQRTVPGFAELQGQANAAATVTVDANPTERRGPFWRHELPVNNTGAVHQAFTVIGVLQGAGPNGTDIVSQQTGAVFVARSPQANGFDAAGRLTQDGQWDYQWDAEDRLIRMQSLSEVPASARQRIFFGYDHLGRRTEKVTYKWVNGDWAWVQTRQYLYDGWNLLAELDHNLDLVRTYGWGADLSGTLRGAGGVGGLIFVKQADGSAGFPAYDGNGNVIALYSAADGGELARYEHAPFGELLRASGPWASANPFRFSTKYQDDETGWYFYGYRYYGPTTGRWLSRDPLGEAGGMNLYNFIHNSPTEWVDLLGLDGLPTNWFLQEAEHLGNQPNIGSRFGAMGYGLIGTVVAIPESIVICGRGAADGLAIQKHQIQEREASGQINIPQAIMSRVGLLVTETIAAPLTLPSNVDRIVMGAPKILGAVKDHVVRMFSDPSVSSVFDLGEDVLIVYGGAKLASCGMSAIRLKFAAAEGRTLALPVPRAGSFNPHLPGGLMTSFEVGESGLFLPAGRAHGANPAGSFLSLDPIPNQAFVRGPMSTLPEWNPATHVSDAFVPPGVRLQMSIANPHPSLPGSGYGLQLQILNDADKARIIYSNTRPLQ